MGSTFLQCHGEVKSIRCESFLLYTYRSMQIQVLNKLEQQEQLPKNCSARCKFIRVYIYSNLNKHINSLQIPIRKDSKRRTIKLKKIVFE